MSWLFAVVSFFWKKNSGMVSCSLLVAVWCGVGVAAGIKDNYEVPIPADV